MHSINFNLAIRCHTCHNFAFCCISDSRHNHLFVLLMLVWESLFMVVFAVNLLISTHCCINPIHEIYTVMSACIENILHNVNKMAIFILCAPLLKCSEPWNCLLWHFEQSHTKQVSPKQGGLIYISHFWFVCPHRACVALRGWGGRLATHCLPVGLIFPDHGGFEWGQRQAVGCMAIQKFLVGSFALVMKSWPVPHHPPSGTTDPPQPWAFVPKMLPTPSPHSQSLNRATQ